MSPHFITYCSGELQELELNGNLRLLHTIRPDGLYLWHQGNRYLNLSSNDYLGLSASPYAHIDLNAIYRQIFGDDAMSRFSYGNPASRLMTGNSPEYDAVELELAALFPGKEALVLGCGYMANSGVLPALTSKDDLILADKLVHASIIEGLQQAEADFKRFRHNDMNHLEHLLHKAQARHIWVIVESIYSMDGDLAPIQELIELKHRYGFNLYVDEAHAFATRGPQGAGYCAELGVADEVDILICTFGKAMAGSGAAVISDPIIKRYLINKMRPLIFSTALPPDTLRWAAVILHEQHTPTLTALGIPPLSTLRERLSHVVSFFNLHTGTNSASPIIPIPAGSSKKALRLAEEGRSAGFWLTAIRHPTVARGCERIRLSLNAGLTDDQLSALSNMICKNLG